MTICQRNARVQLLIEQIQKEPKRFDYDFVFGEFARVFPDCPGSLQEAKKYNCSVEEFIQDCTTTACFAGWTIALFAWKENLEDLYSPNFNSALSMGNWMTKAAELLGLTEEEGETLFAGSKKSCRNFEEAITFLQNFINEVNQRQQDREEEESESNAAV
jgi:hypothetical protein